MREFRKWFLISSILILIISWNVNCGGYSEKKEAERRIKIIESALEVETEPIEKLQSLLVTKGCVDEDCVNKFLDKILDKFLQKVPNIKRLPGEGKYYISGIALTPSSNTWTQFWPSDNSIEVSRKLFYYIKNEAEIVTPIAHEIGHCIIKDIVFFSREKKEETADLIGIILMSKVGYNTLCAVDIFQRVVASEVHGEKDRRKLRKRIEHLSNYAKIFFKEDQKKWILFTPEDLEKIKEICRKFEKQNGDYSPFFYFLNFYTIITVVTVV